MGLCLNNDFLCPVTDEDERRTQSPGFKTSFRNLRRTTETLHTGFQVFTDQPSESVPVVQKLTECFQQITTGRLRKISQRLQKSFFHHYRCRKQTAATPTLSSYNSKGSSESQLSPDLHPTHMIQQNIMKVGLMKHYFNLEN